MADTTPNPHERRAQALAEITQMQQDLVAAHARIAELENASRDQQTKLLREINKQEARAEAAEQDRARYRAESILYRSKLSEMIATIRNIGQLTLDAQKVSMTLQAIFSDETDDQKHEEEESARQIVAQLPGGDDRGHAVEGDEGLDMDRFEREMETLIRQRPTDREESPGQ